MAATGLGKDFRVLWAANSVSTLGDGMVAAAAPLLVASVSGNPVLVGLAVFVQQLPWLLFALVSGVFIDRLDKRRLIVAVDAGRGVLTALLALAVWSGHASIPVIYVTAFVLGTGETLAETAASTLVPAVVPPELLPTANSRLHGSYFVLNKFAGRPAGASLFVLAAAVPFGLDATSFVVSAALVATMHGIRRERGAVPPAPSAERPPDAPAPAPAPAPASAPPPVPAPAPARSSVRADIAEGLRWLWAEPVIRMLTVALCLMNLTLTAGMSILVLYARDRLGTGEVGYGFLLSASAVGGVFGALLAPRLQAWLSASVLLRAGLVIETLTHVGLACATTGWVAGAVLVAFGVHSSVFGGVETTFRQRRVPEELRGRVQSAFMTFALGGNVLGALIGGPLVRWYGVTAPFWWSAAGMAVLTAVAWRPFGRNLRPGQGGRAAGRPAVTHS
ncbi:MFS transporter [Streptomyces sp. HPF1205]|uniref:MFS transporter n=1 Tax=Streptomyces sp. HPF1205 TaxID=2873262 RepID=UPI001CED834B|nr:MFS transporter [Streptomyces sp. HPF1205]